MCDPITLATVAVVGSIATGAMSAVSAQQQASAQRSAAENNARLESDAAANAAAVDYQQLNTQQNEIDRQSAQEAQQRAVLAMKERAALRVSQGEAGVGGISAARNENDVTMQMSNDLATIESNKKSKINQSQMQKQQVNATALSRRNQSISSMNSVYANSKTPAAWASGLQIGLGAANAGMSAYALGNKLNDK